MKRLGAPSQDHGPQGPTVAAARRLRPPGLRDPRLLIGVVVMALSVLIGAAVLGGHSDARTALVLRHDVLAGASLGPADLRTARVEFVGSRTAASYFLDGDQPAAGIHATRALSAGELLPRAAVTTTTAAPRLEVALSIGVDDLPTTVVQGSTVDVWVVPEAAKSQIAPRARLVLAKVPVLHIAHQAGSLAPQASRQVIVGLSAADEQRTLAGALGSVASGRVLITRRD